MWTIVASILLIRAISSDVLVNILNKINLDFRFTNFIDYFTNFVSIWYSIVEIYCAILVSCCVENKQKWRVQWPNSNPTQQVYIVCICELKVPLDIDTKFKGPIPKGNFEDTNLLFVCDPICFTVQFECFNQSWKKASKINCFRNLHLLFFIVENIYFSFVELFLLISRMTRFLCVSIRFWKFVTFTKI